MQITINRTVVSISIEIDFLFSHECMQARMKSWELPGRLAPACIYRTDKSGTFTRLPLYQYHIKRGSGQKQLHQHSHHSLLSLPPIGRSHLLTTMPPKKSTITSQNKKWSNTGEEADILRELIANGDITPSDLPKQIYEMRPEFQRFTLAQFRSGLNRIKSQTGFNVRSRKHYLGLS